MFCLFSFVTIISTVSFSLILSFSLGYHLLADSQTSFNRYAMCVLKPCVISVFCRLWQFQIGMAAFYCGGMLEKRLEETYEEEDKESLIDEQHSSRKPSQSVIHTIQLLFWISLYLLIFCSLNLSPLPSKVVRVVSTVVSGTVILFGSHVQNNPLNWK